MTINTETPPEGQLRDFVVVLRCQSGAHVRQESPMGLRLNHPTGSMAVIMGTNYVDIGAEHPLPRELWFDVRLKAVDLDAAIAFASSVAVGLAAMIAFCTNASVQTPRWHIAYDATPGLTERQFREAFVPDQIGGMSPCRFVPMQPFFDFINASGASATPHHERLARAVGQYEVALRYWNTGALILCLAHLYIACEVLADAVEEHRRQALGISKEDHAKRFDIETAAPLCKSCGTILGKRWGPELLTVVRREYIFQGDVDTYRAAKKASDQFEHGYAPFEMIRATAKTATEEVFGYIRAAILDLLDQLPSESREVLLSKRPVDVTPLRKVIEVNLQGNVEDPTRMGKGDEPHPVIHWVSSVKSVAVNPEGEWNLTYKEEFRLDTAEGVAFQGGSYGVWGGMNTAPERPDGAVLLDPSGDQTANTATGPSS